MDEISSDRLEPTAGIPTTQPQAPHPEAVKRQPRRSSRREPSVKPAEPTPQQEPIPHKVDSLA